MSRKSSMPELNESPVLLIIGTRPEGIKMAPVYHALKRAGIPTLICSTMQHSHLLTEVFELFDIVPDISLNIMRQGQDLFYLTQAVLQKTKEVFLSVHPSLVVVQGDTTSSMAASLAAFYLNIPVAHVEAGLRTDDVSLPFPEEMNRRVISMVSAYHFAPTPAAVANLLVHGVRREKIFCTGNTIVDALHTIKDKIQTKELKIRADIKEKILLAQEEGKDIGLLTMHRRESFNGPIADILQTIKKWISDHPETVWFYPFHPNPSVIDAVRSAGLFDIPNLYICEPINYKDLVYLLDKATYVLTDSGGIQEEAVSLGKPVLVLREKTERMEGVLVGLARIVGSNAQSILDGLEWASSYQKSLKGQLAHVYGDGHASEKIVAFIQAHYDELLQGAAEIPVAQQEDTVPKKKDTSVKKVCIVGLGYIGLPTAIVAAESGYEVIGYDIDEQRVAKINAGDPIIHEPEAYEKLQYVLGAGSFKATTEIEAADYFVIAVPTPITKDKKADVGFVYSAIDAICVVLQKGNTVIIESTIPVGCTQNVANYIAEKTGLQAGIDVFIAHCPERVLPGNIFYELVANDRIIGGIDQACLQPAQSFYDRFVNGHLYQTSAHSAEMVKLIENSSRDVQLAFAHQVGSMATSIGLNPYEVISLANKHPRVNILRPTCGVGGHCIAVDPWFLVESFPKQTELLKAARVVNDNKPKETVSRIKKVVHEWQQNNNGRCAVQLLGVSYKPNVEDVRESPALEVARTIIEDQSIQTIVTDPHVDPALLSEYFEDSVMNFAEGFSKADIVIFLVAHDRFKLIDRKLLSGKIVLDFCGMLHGSKGATEQEEIFWPARSMMDFFVANQQQDDIEVS